MNRAITNWIRFVMDELIPPIIRDSYLFMWPFYYLAYGGKNINKTMNFKKLVHEWSDEEYIDFYNNLNSLSRNRKTDLNGLCIDRIIKAVEPIDTRILDVGCSAGWLLGEIGRANKSIELNGCDILRKSEATFNYTPYEGNQLPFKDNEFDIVVCTHTIEHILNPQKFISELKRVCKKKLIVVVPKQRMFYYTLDEHVNFFYFAEQLTSLIDIEDSTCENLGGDWFYSASPSSNKPNRTGA